MQGYLHKAAKLVRLLLSNIWLCPTVKNFKAPGFGNFLFSLKVGNLLEIYRTKISQIITLKDYSYTFIVNNNGTIVSRKINKYALKSAIDFILYN